MHSVTHDGGIEMFNRRMARGLCLAIVMLPLIAAPARATSPATETTWAAAFTGEGIVTGAEACTGSVTTIPSVTVTTYPPALDTLKDVVLAAANCGGTLQGATRSIVLGVYRNATRVDEETCAADQCSIDVPIYELAPATVVAEFHWKVQAGVWSEQAPARCAADSTTDPTMLRCSADILVAG